MLDDVEISVHKVDRTQKKGGNPNITVISLSGLFAAVLKSQKEDAKKYRRWVTGEVLPKIHGEGGYITEAKQKEIEANIIDRIETERLEEEWREHKKEITAEIRRRREGVFGKGAEGLGKFLGSFGLNIKPADPNDGAVQEYFRKVDEAS